jgi:hypothetical protein
MKGYLLLVNIAYLAFLTANLSPVFGQSNPRLVRVAATDNTAAIINLVKDWGVVQDILIINNYATLNYAYGQNGGNVIFQRKNKKWTIIDGKWTIADGGGRNVDYCLDINCLVNKGVPRNIATDLLDSRENFYKLANRELNSFRQSWSAKNKNTAPFLGYWRNMDYPSSSSRIAISVWPSLVPNRVCLVDISRNSQSVKIGVSSGNKIQVNNFVFTHGDEADGEYISSGKNYDYVVSPRPLNTWYLNIATKKKLRDAGCTASLPSR